jgi:signal transduction histidine kinase
MNRDTALTLFRIFQETLTNVARHAQATEVQVKLLIERWAFVLRIHDNGVGIGDADLIKPTSHGIRGMRERASSLAGTSRPESTG